MATRLVADFMSVLHYVTYKNDAQITSYTSDPILTFGASYMWYQLDSPALESHILQQFQVILLKGVVDTGNMGQIAARIFLLLAIDATIMGSEVRENAEARKEFVFTGQFCKVPHFVKKLVGAKPEIREDKSAAHLETRNLYSHWLSSHFVELVEEPTEATLWKMLDRRAAGIFPRNRKGADLIIPMFCSKEVSFILIKVKNRVEASDKFPDSVLQKLSPSHVFTEANSLHRSDNVKMIKLFISLHDAHEACTTSAQCIVVPSKIATRNHEKELPETDYLLCIRGLFALNSVADNIAETPERWPFCQWS
ncbi:hypothetical protein GQ600_12090 [Phytophthora cactorum]|nr:hypothetical protein GQ600_12090 [Phytophthora cactorum]